MPLVLLPALFLPEGQLPFPLLLPALFDCGLPRGLLPLPLELEGLLGLGPRPGPADGPDTDPAGPG